MAEYKKDVYISKIEISGKPVPLLIERIDNIGKYSFDYWDETMFEFSTLFLMETEELTQLISKINKKGDC